MTVGFPVTRDTSAPNRAQVEVLGVVLLIGMVSIAALGLMLVANGAVADNEAQVEKERIEQSFVQLSHTMATVTANGEMPKSVDFDAGDSGAITKTDAGTFTIRGGDVNESITVGAIEYEHEDGSIVAYQAGGVWAEQGNQTRMLSAPPISYDDADETLIMPVTNMSEKRDLSSGTIRTSLNRTKPLREASIVENDSVEITIQSPYYRGWERFFETRAGDTSVQYVDHGNNTVGIELGYRELSQSFGSGVSVPDSDSLEDHQSGPIGSDFSYNNSYELDTVISDMVSDAKDDKDDPDEDVTDLGVVDGYESVSDGMYYARGIHGNDSGHLEADLTGGNVTVIVDGDIIGGGKTVTVSDHTGENALKVYTTGDLDMRTTTKICVDTAGNCDSNIDASRIQVYGTSNMTLNFDHGNSRYEGVLYAASENDRWTDPVHNCGESVQVCFGGSVDYYGSLVAGSVKATNNFDFEYDNSLAGEDINTYPAEYSLPPQLTYLNIAIHEMDVSNE